jgi:hypothetical protein
MKNTEVKKIKRYKWQFGGDACDCDMINSEDYNFLGGYIKVEDGKKIIIDAFKAGVYHCYFEGKDNPYPNEDEYLKQQLNNMS